MIEHLKALDVKTSEGLPIDTTKSVSVPTGNIPENNINFPKIMLDISSIIVYYMGVAKDSRCRMT